MKKNIPINTPKLMEAFYSKDKVVIEGKESQAIISPSKSSPNDTLTLSEKEDIKPVKSSSPQILETIPYDPVIGTTNTNYLEDGEFWTNAETVDEAWKESKPSGYELGRNQVGGPPGIRMKDIKFIVLHHTATKVSVKDTQLKSFKPSSYGKSSHAIIGTDGHVEYVVPLPFKANAQGKNKWVRGKTVLPFGVKSYFNSVATSVELINYGFLNREYKDENGNLFYYRQESGQTEQGAKNNGVFAESKTSEPYDYYGNPIGRYKTFNRCEEYTDAQLNAMVAWIKKQQKYIADNYPNNSEILNWKYTADTHNQMFPNYKSNKLPKNFAKKGGEFIEKGYLITGMSQGTYNGNPSGWAVSKDIYDAKIGIYTHNSIATGKSDIFPTKKMVACLKNNFG